MRSVSVPRAVTMITGTSRSARSTRQTSRPSPSGRARSSSTRSGSVSRAAVSASAAVAATVVSKPSRRSSRANGSAIDASSSTIRIRTAIGERM